MAAGEVHGDALSASERRRQLEAELQQLTKCQGVCGKKVELRDIRASGGFDVCVACLASPAWAEELKNRRSQPPASRKLMGRRTVKG